MLTYITAENNYFSHIPANIKNLLEQFLYLNPCCGLSKCKCLSCRRYANPGELIPKFTARIEVTRRELILILNTARYEFPFRQFPKLQEQIRSNPMQVQNMITRAFAANGSYQLYDCYTCIDNCTIKIINGKFVVVISLKCQCEIDEIREEIMQKLSFYTTACSIV